MTTIPSSILRRLLRPILRICLRHSIKIQEIDEALKAAFVEIASEDLERSGSTLSVSRLSAMTGMHRRDVTRLVQERDTKPGTTNLVIKTIGQWKEDDRFSTGGKPKLLSFEGKNSEFSQLCGVVSMDLNPYTVLFEMERLQLVERTKGGLKLKAAALISRDDFETGLKLLATDSEDLHRAVYQNLSSTKDLTANLHLRTEFDNLRTDKLAEIRRWLIEEGSQLHTRARNYISKFDLDINPIPSPRSGPGAISGGGKVSFTTFSLTESEP